MRLYESSPLEVLYESMKNKNVNFKFCILFKNIIIILFIYVFETK